MIHQSIATAMLIAAHPDDEIVGCGAWAWRYPGRLAVAFLTNGVPLDRRCFASGYNEPAAYARARRNEARSVWARHPRPPQLLFAAFSDQNLAFCLPAAAAWLAARIARFAPSAILAPAFEGGHPDHDAANLLAAHAGARYGIEVFEYALYRSENGAILRQSFHNCPSVVLPPREAARKRRLMELYASQAATLRDFDPACEAIRPRPPHNYRQPVAETVYGFWGWPIRPTAVAAAFTCFLDTAIPRPTACAFSSSPIR